MDAKEQIESGEDRAKGSEQGFFTPLSGAGAVLLAIGAMKAGDQDASRAQFVTYIFATTLGLALIGIDRTRKSQWTNTRKLWVYITLTIVVIAATVFAALIYSPMT